MRATGLVSQARVWALAWQVMVPACQAWAPVWVRLAWGRVSACRVLGLAPVCLVWVPVLAWPARARATQVLVWAQERGRATAWVTARELATQAPVTDSRALAPAPESRALLQLACRRRRHRKR